MRSSIDSAADRRAPVLDRLARAARDADPADDREHEVLRADARAERPVHRDRQRLRLALQEALRREHVRDLGRADPERERAEGAVGAGVAVAADDRHARLREPELRADHVHDAAPRITQAQQLEAVLARVALQLADLPRRRLEPDRQPAEHLGAVGRHGVIERRDRALRSPHAEVARFQLGESLRRGDLVREMQVDGEHRGRLGGFGQDLVRLPDLLEQGPRAHGDAQSIGSRPSILSPAMYTVSLANPDIAALFGLRV